MKQNNKPYNKNAKFNKPYKSRGAKETNGTATKTFAPTGNCGYDDIQSNDINWWNKAKGIYEYACNVPFNKLTGAEYPQLSVAKSSSFIQDVDGRPAAVAKGTASLPTMMRIMYTPGIGVAEDHNDAPNRAFQAMYSALYSRTSGSSLGFPTYSLAMHVIATQSIAQNIALVKRALGVSNFWTAQNLSTPRMMLTALGIDPDSVLNHQNDIAMRLNNIIRDFNTIKVPAYIDVFKRHYALCHNIYADMDSVRAQFYAFVPTVYYLYSDIGTYDGTEFDGISTAVACSYGWENNPISIDYLMDIIMHQINLVRNSSDFVQLSGALQRGFPDSAFLSIDLATPNDITIPVPDFNIAYQIHNMDVVGFPSFARHEWPNIGAQMTAYGCAITGDPVENLVKYRPYVMSEMHEAYACITSGTDCYASLLNFFDAKDVTTENVMEATRLKSYWTEVNSRMKVAKYIGTEFVNAVIMYTPYPVGSGVVAHVLPTVFCSEESFDGSQHGANYTAGMLTALTKFHKGPRIRCVHYTKGSVDDPTDTGTIRSDGFIGDLLYWTEVTPDQLRGLHTAALLSVFSTDSVISLK